jgi:hypothetical protein
MTTVKTHSRPLECLPNVFNRFFLAETRVGGVEKII